MPTFKEIQAECALSGELWEDPDFPANYDSILPGGYDVDNYVWKRPKEISKEAPKFIEAGASRFDLAQGELGDCWFISSAAVLATQPDLFSRVVPLDQGFEEEYIGAFRFNFWQCGDWIEVVVDDRLPVTPEGELAFGVNRSQPNEFWGPLLEKAYAKLYTFYYAISEGHIKEALVDLTGGLSEYYNLSRVDRLPENLFEIIKTSFTNGSLMGASIWNAKGKTVEEEQTSGLFKGHAYSVTGVLETEIRGSPAQLIRFKNPWGKSEWNGAWSDGSVEWLEVTEEEKKQIDLVIQDDGEFWMSFEDMKSNFNVLDMVHLGPATLARCETPERPIKWHCVEYNGQWVKGVNAGGSGVLTPKKFYYRNPQYFVTLKGGDEGGENAEGKCTLIVSLMLKDYRERRNSTTKKNLIVGFDVCEVLSGEPEILDGVSFEERTALEEQFSGSSSVRESTSRITLKPGTYVIIPYAYKADQEGPYYLRIFTHSVADSVEIKEETGPIQKEEELLPLPKPSGVLSRETFGKYAGVDLVIDAKELSSLLNDLFEQEFGTSASFSVEACRTLLAIEDHEHIGLLSYKQTAKFWDEILFWKKVFESHDSDMSGAIETWELRQAFRAVGFSLSFSSVATLAIRYGGKDRTLSFEDFVLCLTKTMTMYTAFKEFSQSSPGEARLDLESWMETTLGY